MKTKTTTTLPALPKGMRASDLKRPSWRSKDRLDFEACPGGSFQMIHVGDWGWCLATLLIRKAGRRAVEGGDRTYAVRIATGETVAVGLGPHVKARATVYVRKSRGKALAGYLEMIRQGAERANQIRDRISTRRAQTALRRFPWEARP